jgi:hypothetical protein
MHAFLVLYAAVQLDGIPHVQQKPDFCGEACTEMVLKKLGSALSQDDVFNLSGLDPAEGRGLYTRELKAALERVGFSPGQVYYSFPAREAAAQLEQLWASLHADLMRGVPSIVCTHFDESPDTTEHFRLVIGYDPKRDEVLYHDPALPKGGQLRMPRARLLALWPLKYEARTWTAIRLRMEPRRLVEPPKPPGRFSPADYAQHVMKLKDKLGKGFQVAIEPPFVVISNGSDRQRSTVRWAVTMLKRDFFAGDPDRILDVWLMEDAASYERVAKRLTGEDADTPYGFYSPSAGALIMNIATGGGTLVHEIVHPFMDSNFPSVPPWYNEGLGSLYEQSGEEDGHIVGYTNWRLAGLQRAIQRGILPQFPSLLAMNSKQFYHEDTADNYAQSRYLLYYLQQQKLLVKFHREFFRSRKSDPTGVNTLKKILGEEDLGAFQKRWEKWVMTLRFAG